MIDSLLILTFLGYEQLVKINMFMMLFKMLKKRKEQQLNIFVINLFSLRYYHIITD